MRVILTEDVAGLGSSGAEVAVKGGYARNFLLPSRLAVSASRKNKAINEHHRRVITRQQEKLLNTAKATADRLSKLSLTVARQVGEDERIFGTVTTGELEKMIKAEGIEVSRKDIVLAEEIKKTGIYEAEIKLHPQLTAKFKIWVVAA